MLMGFVGLPISIALYWLMLRPKKNDPFPKGGLFRLIIAAAISVVLSSVLSLPISFLVSLIRSGALADIPGLIEMIEQDPEAFKGLVYNADGTAPTLTVRSIVDMFFSAGLLEEGLKYLTCRIAIRKKGMIRTWMDAVVAFAIVGITFELLENVAFGAGSDILSAFMRALASAHFAFGVIMGYFYGKSLVTGKKRYRLLSFFVPLIYHSVANGLIASMKLSKINYVIGVASSISFIVAAVLAVIVVLRWQKNRTLVIPVLQK
ncbi:MAG: PrsW family intramembrane metalloprotease [Erysipelotrichaceae bacterium]|nr:PrsW family intramembrane metalloprotease [Erysipelotrichaceae bacterium]